MFWPIVKENFASDGEDLGQKCAESELNRS
jgi:hypothetical protein